METTLPPRTKAKLLLPAVPLANCLFGAFVRDTRGCNLAADQRFNHFASSPLCSVSWFFEGQCHHLENREQMSEPASAPIFPNLVFSGPYQQPQTSWNAGDINAMILAFYPDAFAALTGTSVADYTNRSVPVEEVFSGDLLQMVLDIFETGETETGFQLAEKTLTPLWQKARPDHPVFGHRVADWCRSLGIRAVTSGVGKSTRQIERRVRSWAGQSKRNLMIYVRSELAFQHALTAKAEGDLNLADMSAELGYSDQAHMGRQIRSITGFSPADFMKRYDHEEAFWSFRLMGERF